MGIRDHLGPDSTCSEEAWIESRPRHYLRCKFGHVLTTLELSFKIYNMALIIPTTKGCYEVEMGSGEMPSGAVPIITVIGIYKPASFLFIPCQSGGRR